MKRDLDLLRAILLHLFMFHPNELDNNLDLLDYRTTAVRHHVDLLHGSGLIRRVWESPDGDTWDGLRLTNDGYDFVAMVSDDMEWTVVKNAVLVGTGGQNFAMVRKVLEERARAKLGAAPR